MAVTKAWKVYGRDGHRQRESFRESAKFNTEASKDNLGGETETVTVEVENFDKTGTHDYSIVRITASTPEMCERELFAQFDGVFENCWTGKVEEI